MSWICTSLLVLAHFALSVCFRLQQGSRSNSLYKTSMQSSDASDPLLLRAARGEVVDRVPVWMMRQAGRHMQVYRDLCTKHTTFRERSENADVATEIRYHCFSALTAFRFYCVFMLQFAALASLWHRRLHSVLRYSHTVARHGRRL